VVELTPIVLPVPLLANGAAWRSPLSAMDGSELAVDADADADEDASADAGAGAGAPALLLGVPTWREAGPPVPATVSASAVRATSGGGEAATCSAPGSSTGHPIKTRVNTAYPHDAIHDAGRHPERRIGSAIALPPVEFGQ
jgi:hypothetical protein